MEDFRYKQLIDIEKSSKKAVVHLNRYQKGCLLVLNWIAKLGLLFFVIIVLAFNLYKIKEHRFLIMFAVSIPVCVICFFAKVDYDARKINSHVHNAINILFYLITTALFILEFALFIAEFFWPDYLKKILLSVMLIKEKFGR